VDTERLRLLAASYRLRARASGNDFTRAYEDGMASYLEAAADWIEAKQKQELSAFDGTTAGRSEAPKN
jgi:hypothetical protein